MTLLRKVRWFMYTIAVLMLCVAVYIYNSVYLGYEKKQDKLVIPEGVGISWLTHHLHEQGMISEPYSMRLYAEFTGASKRIKAGEYSLLLVEDIPGLLSKVTRGEVISYSITFIEGWSFKQIMAHLKQQNGLVKELEGLDDKQIMAKLGVPNLHPEGRFAPNTYLYQKGDSEFDVLKQAYDNMKFWLDEAWQQTENKKLIKNRDELLTLASIIEKETGQPSERGTISGVFYNRLKKGIRLQTDPTVIYGMGDAYKGNIKRIHLQTDTPYNTYTRYGLPPTPIAMPGRDALLAAAKPESTKAFYFVGKGDGNHYFSETLEEHNKAVIKYQLNGKPKSFSSYKKPKTDSE